MLKLNEFTETLQQESTRDMAWALFSPEMLNDTKVTHFLVEPTTERLEWLKKLDKQTTKPIGIIEPAQRLGRYYESLWTYFFRHDTQYKLVAHNLAIRNPHKTLGEIDFIVYDNLAGQLIHLEIAVKFYLFHAPADSCSIADNSHWPGPNSNDTLEKKWHKLCTEQLVLSQREECKRLLQLSGINEPVKPAVSLKGYLFRQPGSSQTPLQFNPANWIHAYYNAASFLDNHADKRLLGIIPKSRWLTEIHDKQHIALGNAEDIVRKMEKRATPVMAGTFEEFGNSFRETERFFIVPEQWP